MKSDRELLELAAKSIGGIYDHKIYYISFDGGKNWMQWEPLEDNTDAMMIFNGGYANSFEKARRRMVENAAAIGEKME